MGHVPEALAIYACIKFSTYIISHNKKVVPIESVEFLRYKAGVTMAMAWVVDGGPNVVIGVSDGTSWTMHTWLDCQKGRIVPGSIVILWIWRYLKG